MNFKNVIRLEFEMVFPEEKPKDILEYLCQVSFEMIIQIIGFSNTSPQLNYDTFCSNPSVKSEIIKRVENYCRINQIKTKPTLVSRESSLRLSELILKNEDVLKNNKGNGNDSDELNLFKCYLLINKKVNKKEKLTNNDGGIDDVVDMFITFFFSSSEFGVFEENNDIEFLKIMYSTFVKFEYLIEFIQSKPEFIYLKKGLVKNFNLNSVDKLNYHMSYLFGKLLELKGKNGFKFKVDDKETMSFLDSLVSQQVSPDEDFTLVKNHPLYKIDSDIYSIIDYFFVIDKFYKGLKFVLKSLFESHNTRGNFFQFYNTEFTEKFLGKKILDEIFNKNHFVKKKENISSDREPDYYLRHNKIIYLFEIKDVLVRKEIKSSGNIDKINKVLKSKFLHDETRPVGIGQLVESIYQIVDNSFEYDDYVNTKKNFTIYPIVIVGERTFEILGINFRLNEWYQNSIRKKLNSKYNSRFIKPFTIVDIDTLIYWSEYLKENDTNFRDLLELHLKGMLSKNVNKSFIPISQRQFGYSFNTELLMNKFKKYHT